MNEETQLEFIEILESIRHKFKPKSYRFLLAESLVSYHYTFTKSATEIKNYTNEILEEKNINAVSLGFIRNIIEEKQED